MRRGKMKRGSKGKKGMKMASNRRSAWKSFWNRYCNM